MDKMPYEDLLGRMRGISGGRQKHRFAHAKAPGVRMGGVG